MKTYCQETIIIYVPQLGKFQSKVKAIVHCAWRYGMSVLLFDTQVRLSFFNRKSEYKPPVKSVNDSKNAILHLCLYGGVGCRFNFNV